MILFNLLPDSYDYIIIIIILYSKKTHILEEVTSTLLSNENRKGQIKRRDMIRFLWSREGKEEEKERNARARQRRVAFVIGKIIEKMAASIDKSVEEEGASFGGRRIK